jgi:NADH pyrophosphatase NudC (nudix superfamily)
MDKVNLIVGVVVYDQDSRLLLCRSKANAVGSWLILGGHLELGETLIDCAKREVMEEASINVEEVALLNVLESIYSEDINPQKHYVMLNFSARATSTEFKLSNEHTELRWFSKDELRQLTINNSSNRSISEFFGWGQS